MDRRKFLIGAGSLAAGGAAAMGSGAFTSVEADRQVSVSVTGDSSAYLGLQNSGHANDQYFNASSSGEASIDFANSGNGGTGVNEDARTVLKRVFTIVNQGTQAVEVSLASDDLYLKSPGIIYRSKYTDGISVGLHTNEDQLNSGSNRDRNDDAVELDPGKSVDVDFVIDTTGTSSSTLSGELTIKADAETTNA